MNDDFIDPENLGSFNLPENVINQLFEFTGSQTETADLFFLLLISKDYLL